MANKYNIKQDYPILKAVCISTIIGIAAFAVLLPMFAAIIAALNLNVSSAGPLASLCIGAGSFVSGFWASKKIKNRGILIGAVCGAVMFTLLKLVALIINPLGFTLITLIHFAIIVICGCIGGVLGVNSTNKRKIV